MSSIAEYETLVEQDISLEDLRGILEPESIAKYPEHQGLIIQDLVDPVRAHGDSVARQDIMLLGLEATLAKQYHSIPDLLDRLEAFRATLPVFPRDPQDDREVDPCLLELPPGVQQLQLTSLNDSETTQASPRECHTPVSRIKT